MLEIFQKIVDFLTVDLSFCAPYIVIGLVVSFVIIFIVELVFATIKTVEYSTVYYQSYLLLNLLITTYFSIEDLLGLSVIFKTSKSIYAFITIMAVFSTILFVVVKTVSIKVKTKVTLVIKKQDRTEDVTPSRAVEYFKNGERFTGYLDVKYTKSLIENLKTKNLSELFKEDFS